MNEKEESVAGKIIYQLNKEREGHHMGDCAGEACPDWLTRQHKIIGNALTTVRQEARAAAFREAIAVARSLFHNSEVNHSRWNVAVVEIVKALKAAANPTPKQAPKENEPTNV